MGTSRKGGVSILNIIKEKNILGIIYKFFKENLLNYVMKYYSKN